MDRNFPGICNIVTRIQVVQQNLQNLVWNINRVLCNPKHKLYHLFPGGTCKCHLYHCHRKYVIFQDFTEKNIKINLQKPHNTTKGFGFSISGGVEKKQPITVYKVNIGRSTPPCCRPRTQVTHPAPDRLIPRSADLTGSVIPPWL